MSEPIDEFEQEVDAAYAWLNDIGHQIAERAEILSGMGGDHDYDGAVEVIWSGIHEALGIDPGTCMASNPKRDCGLTPRYESPKPPRKTFRYVVAWPDGVLKVGITNGDRWAKFVETGATVLALDEFKSKRDALEAERTAHTFLSKYFPRAFDMAERATPYMPYGAGFTECYRVPSDQITDVLGIIQQSGV